MVTALYRRYRPDNFAEVIGQDHVTQPLMRALRHSRVGHAYLFSGPRGCGKTTSARILARCLNCASGPTDSPCGTCDSCVDLASGGSGSLDVVEIDAASHGGVDDARELRERATFAPARDRYKIFIIDEAHMVTSAGFNALLKLVEEPPPHVKFIFATTEPDKVIGTIRSRTHHYPFRLIPPQILTPYIADLCRAEGVRVDPAVLPLVVRAGGGSARDTLSVLDQLMAGAGDDGVDYAMAVALLGFTDSDLLDRVVDGIGNYDARAVYGGVEQVIASGQEPRRFVEDLLERLRDLIVLAAVPDRAAEMLPDVPADQLERLQEQVKLFTPAQLSAYGEIVDESLSSMVGATSPRLHLELLCARLLLSGNIGNGSATAATSPQSNSVSVKAASRTTAAVAAPQSTQTPAPQATSDAPVPRDIPASESPVERARRIAREQAEANRRQAAELKQSQVQAQVQVQAQPQNPPQPQSQAQSERPDPAVKLQAAETTAQTESAAAGGAEAVAAGATSENRAAEVKEHWSALMDVLQTIRRPSHALINRNSQPEYFDGSLLILGFKSQGLVTAFGRGTGAANLAEAVKRVLHVNVEVRAQVSGEPLNLSAAPSSVTSAPAIDASASASSPAPTAPQAPAAIHTAPTQSAPVEEHPEPPVEDDWDDHSYDASLYDASSSAPNASVSNVSASNSPAEDQQARAAGAQQANDVNELAAGKENEPAQAAPATKLDENVQLPESKGRDGLDSDQPRTHGQEALKAALEAYKDGRDPMAAAAGALERVAAELAANPAPPRQNQPSQKTSVAPVPSTGTGNSTGASSLRARAEAAVPAQKPRSTPDDDTDGASRDDVDIDDSKLAGASVIEELLGGKVIEVQTPDGKQIPGRR